MQKRKICVITGSRAEYGLLFLLMDEIKKAVNLELQLIVTGMHLSPEFGLTYRQIEEDFKIDKKIEMLLSSDTAIGISKSMALAQISFSEAFGELKPDIALVLGDRYEIFSAVCAAMIANIPIAHLDGGETTEGAFDEAIRHSISKMSHLHFTCTEEYRQRVIQLGEDPQRVFNAGATGIDNIKKLSLLTKTEFEDSIGFKLNTHNLLVTFHPVTLETTTASVQFNQLLEVLGSLEDTNIIFTKANSDKDGRVINEMIDKYVNKNPYKSIAFASMGQIRYLSAMQYVDACVGNSSSGIIEAPYFNIGTINIGDRQKGRARVKSIIDCEPIDSSIVRAFKKLYSFEFQESLKKIEYIYGDGQAVSRIIEVIQNYDLTNILKKEFFDIKYSD